MIARIGMNTNTLKCLSSIVRMMCSLSFAAGALAHVEEGQKRAINEAVSKGQWSTACTLLKAVLEGMLSCSTW